MSAPFRARRRFFTGVLKPRSPLPKGKRVVAFFQQIAPLL
jgi:hypothetical protein